MAPSEWPAFVLIKIRHISCNTSLPNFVVTTAVVTIVAISIDTASAVVIVVIIGVDLPYQCIQYCP